ncbi:hypothetical protein D3C79_663220 [compost metagenome]
MAERVTLIAAFGGLNGLECKWILLGFIFLGMLLVGRLKVCLRELFIMFIRAGMLGIVLGLGSIPLVVCMCRSNQQKILRKRIERKEVCFTSRNYLALFLGWRVPYSLSLK